MAAVKTVRTRDIDIAYEESGPADGPATLLLHGFPYDPRAFDDVVSPLGAAGLRVIVPYLRGYGPTRFLSDLTPRSGQQAAIGQDAIDLLDALRIERAGLVGFDWGARAACIVAAVAPERTRFLVSVCGYQIQDIAASARPAMPEQERRYWYQYYFNTERGRVGLDENRYDLCRLLWRLWSPTWDFAEAAYARTAASFDNPDFVAVAIHSYRHRYGYAAGDPRFEALEGRLAQRPPIGAPTLALHGADDDVTPPDLSRANEACFTGPYTRRLLSGVGHNLPQEAPAELVRGILELAAAAAK